jgi:hypothetical protein
MFERLRTWARRIKRDVVALWLAAIAAAAVIFLPAP